MIKLSVALLISYISQTVEAEHVENIEDLLDRVSHTKRNDLIENMKNQIKNVETFKMDTLANETEELDQIAQL